MLTYRDKQTHQRMTPHELACSNPACRCCMTGGYWAYEPDPLDDPVGRSLQSALNLAEDVLKSAWAGCRSRDLAHPAYVDATNLVVGAFCTAIRSWSTAQADKRIAAGCLMRGDVSGFKVESDIETTARASARPFIRSCLFAAEAGLSLPGLSKMKREDAAALIKQQPRRDVRGIQMEL